MKTIAVIDDDIYIGNMVEEVLRREGYSVLRAYSGTEALMLFERNVPDLVLLDLMMPGLPGEEVLQKMIGIPVMIVSAKADTQDKVQLLLGGAADYITKPFDIQELLARIAVQLRKNAFAELAPVLTVDGLRLDTGSHELTVNGTPVPLTKTEYAILKLFLLHPGQVIAKSVILERISEDTPDCTDASLKQHISNLRHKLRDVDDKEYLEAVWGIGFRLKN